eukprot:GHRR01024927.1.p1 GENE.GHRR01024927.1~~GHRR01024927.1.p1  ORF type:complete len:163 (+),score=22.94 GHRR01024927.1:96-584(+)
MAKKRKHEAVTGPADENGMEQEAQLPKQHTSGSRVEAETVSYLTDVSEHFASLSSAGDKELLMANVLEEIQGRELKIAADAVTSRLLERLLTGASPSQLIQFLQAFTNVDMMFSLAGRCVTRALQWQPLLPALGVPCSTCCQLLLISHSLPCAYAPLLRCSA